MTLASVRAYREAMAEFAQMRTMDIWYAHLSEQDLMAALDTAAASQKGKAQKKAAQGAAKAAQEGRPEGAHPRQPAGAVQARRARRRQLPHREPAADRDPGPGTGRIVRDVPDEVAAAIREQFRAYRATLQADRRAPARTLRGHRRRPQGRRRRQRRHPGVHRAAAGPRPAGSAVPAGQGGHHLGAGGPSAQEPLPATRASGWCRGSG